MVDFVMAHPSMEANSGYDPVAPRSRPRPSGLAGNACSPWPALREGRNDGWIGGTGRPRRRPPEAALPSTGAAREAARSSLTTESCRGAAGDRSPAPAYGYQGAEAGCSLAFPTQDLRAPQLQDRLSGRRLTEATPIPRASVSTTADRRIA